MKILLLHPIECLRFNSMGYNHGLGSISAVLKQAQHSVELLILQKFDKAKIDRKIKQFAPDVAGIYSPSDQMQLIERCVAYMYHAYHLPVVLGGPHATYAPDECMKIEGLFGICRGEGEFPLLELVNAIEKREDFTGIRNFWFNVNGRIIKNDIRPPIKDLDSLPYADREIFDYQRLIDAKRFRDVEVMCSRGCPYSCTHCTNSALNKLYKGQFLRKRSIQNVIAELLQLKSRYTFKRVFFHDDTFTSDHRYLTDLCKEYKRKINVRFAIQARADTLEEEILRTLKDAGCFMILMGVESGNAYIRNKILKRNMTDEQIQRAFELCRTYKMATLAYNMLGLPFENEHSLQETLALNKRIRPTYVTRFMFRPYPGTELYDLCNEKGWISERKVKGYNEGETILDMPTISKEKILYYQNIFPCEVKKGFLLPLVRILAKFRIKNATLYLLILPYYRKIQHAVYKYFL